MKASESQLLNFLKATQQFDIPIYQRMYSWKEKQCRQLWDDIMRCGKDDNLKMHFMGSVVYIESDLFQSPQNPPLLIIDGQQRVTTIMLLLHVLAEILEQKIGEEEDLIDGFSARKIRNYYLLNPDEKNDRYFKLLLSQTDRETFKSIVNQTELPQEESLNILTNQKLFKSWINDSTNELEALCKGIAKLYIVGITLVRGQDKPQLIFESMNSTGKELSQADLIRNFILMELEPEQQKELFNSYWRPMEKKFGQNDYDKYFDEFMRHYLTFKTGEIPNIRDVYEKFKDYKSKNENLSIDHLIKEIKEFAQHFCCMALGQEKDKDLKLAFNNLLELRIGVAYPFLLELYNDYYNEKLTKNDFLEILRLIEAYVFRRSVCGMATNSLNKTFAAFSKFLEKDKYLESVQAHFILMLSYRQFPNDADFINHIKTRNLYHFRSKNYWLKKLENHDRKDPIQISEYTIEHIMPQSEKLPSEWKKELGDNWKEIHEKYLHTLGNLTLTAYNPEYSNRPFADKRDMNNGFKHSHLKLNEDLKSLEKWDREAIIKRADRLAKKALTVWKNPELSDDILEQYKEDKRGISQYSINNHPYIDVGSDMHEVFEAFRKEVIELDPCISEEFLARYVAYKAETNFVIVIPQRAEIKLSLNMPFSKINDAKAICKDTTELGRWGNYDIEVGLGNINDLPYIMGLVRQALEYQLYNSDDSEI